MPKGLNVKKARKYRVIQPKDVKTIVDERFDSLFTDKRFTTVAKRDIYGRGVREVENDENPASMLISQHDIRVNKSKAGDTENPDIEEKDFNWEASSTSSSSDDEDDDTDKEHEEIRERLRTQLAEEVWDGKSEAALINEATSRLALMGCEWDSITATDLLVLCHSILDGALNKLTRESDVIKSVRIYPSKFGHEKMAYEAKHGPQIKELDLIRKLKVQRRRHHQAAVLGLPSQVCPLSDEDDSDGEEISEETALALRKFQKEKSRYHYAVLECASVNIAEKLYAEIDGLDADFALDGLDLRFIPDDLKDFPYEPVSTATSLPSKYAAPEIFLTALSHSKAKFEWDETPVQRIKLLRKHFNATELAEADLKAYLASDDEEETQEEVEAKRRALFGIQEQADGDSFFVAADEDTSPSLDTSPLLDTSRSLVENSSSKHTRVFPLIAHQENKTKMEAGLINTKHALLEHTSSDSEDEATKRKHGKKRRRLGRKIKTETAAIQSGLSIQDDARFEALKSNSRFQIDGTHPAQVRRCRQLARAS